MQKKIAVEFLFLFIKFLQNKTSPSNLLDSRLLDLIFNYEEQTTWKPNDVLLLSCRAVLPYSFFLRYGLWEIKFIA